MRKKLVMAMVLGMAVMITACSSGKEKTLSEKDLETMSEKQAEEAIMKFAEEYDKDMGIKKEETAKKETTKEETTEEETTEEETTEAETEAEITDPHQVCEPTIVDPYELGLFEIFGLDENFPKPKEGFEVEWEYTVEECGENVFTDEIPEGAGSYLLVCRPKDRMHQLYMLEVEKYLKDIYGNKENYDGPDELGTEFSVWVRDKSWIQVDIGGSEFSIRYTPLEEREVIGIVTGEREIIADEGVYDGESITPFPMHRLVDYDGNEIKLEIGKRVKMKFFEPRSSQIFDGLSKYAYVTSVEILQ